MEHSVGNPAEDEEGEESFERANRDPNRPVGLSCDPRVAPPSRSDPLKSLKFPLLI
jgi:hypothetical protein